MISPGRSGNVIAAQTEAAHLGEEQPVEKLRGSLAGDPSDGEYNPTMAILPCP